MLDSKQMADVSERLFRWSERLRAIAQTGLAFEPHQYDQERYREALELAAEMQAASIGDDAGELSAEWLSRIQRGMRGYVTPQTSIIAIVLNENRELLLLQRPDSKGWFPPAGWADVGRTGAEVAAKEVAEETGYWVRPTSFLGCYDSLINGMSPIHFFCLFWGCRLEGGSLRRNELEALDIGWFPQDRLPAPLHGGDWWVPMAYGWDANSPNPMFDELGEDTLKELWK